MSVSQEEGRLVPPKWLANHSAVTDRSISLDLAVPIKPGVVFLTNHVLYPDKQWAVKILPLGSREDEMYDRLLKAGLAAPNHTLPCERFRTSDDRTFLIMPKLGSVRMLGKDLAILLEYFSQLLEGLEFMHSMHIAHMDISNENCVVALDDRDVQAHPSVESGKLYFIDFGSSVQLELGPGQQPAIDLRPAQFRVFASPDLTRLDPYSWDMFCMGTTFEVLAECLYQDDPQPWLIKRYVQWLVGEEKKCTGVCHCRPTARRARRVLYIVRLLIGAMYIVRGALLRVHGTFF